MAALRSCYKFKKYLCDRLALKKWWSNHFSIITITKLACRKVPLMISWPRIRPFSLSILCFVSAGHLLNFFLKNFWKEFVRFFDPPPRSRLIFNVWVNVVLKNDEKWWSNHFYIIIITNFRSFPSMAEGAFDDQLT